MQHSRDLQLNKKRLLDLDMDALIKQIKGDDFDRKVRSKTRITQSN